MRKASKIIVLLILTVLVSACSATIEDQQEKAKKAVANVFTKEEEAEININEDNFELYLPNNVKIKETSSNNLIFERKSKIYILFFNQNEQATSDIVYKSSIEPSVDYIVNETYEDNDRFGFLLINASDDDSYELTVGSGGVKLTTLTDVKQLASEAEMMTEIVKSFNYK